MKARSPWWLGACVLLITAPLGEAWGDPDPLGRKPPPPALSVSSHVDASANRHAISPEIYGVAFASATDLADLNVPLNRNGGNATSRYNWQLDASNRGSDWYFQSVPQSAGT